MVAFNGARRRLVITAGAAGPGLLLVSASAGLAPAAGRDHGKGQEKEVGAVEDLMREHGVLRRALLVYIECVPKIRANPANVSAESLARTAKLFRAFGEDYHERRLEEPYIFPAVKKAGGQAADYIDVLKAQHDRGREVTDYILSVAGKGTLSDDSELLARALETFVLMYRNYTAREDTIVFPAWQEVLSARQLQEMGDRFEDIERQQFGKDGYDDAVAQIGQIEQLLGLADVAQFTAPPPPKT
jgi:hemerythrin-like domain-containing protein